MPAKSYHFLGITFDVDAAIDLAAQRTPQAHHPSELMAFIPEPKPDDNANLIDGLNPVNEAYAASTTNNDPIIFATACYANGDTFNLLIDGSHRLFKALYLDEADTIECVILNVEDSLTLAKGPVTHFMTEYLKADRKVSG